MDIERYVEALTEEACVRDEGTLRAATGPSPMKAHAIELWRQGDRFLIVTDEEDARRAVEQHLGSRGEVWTVGEVEVVASVTDQSARDEIERWKRSFDGRLRRDG